MFCRRTAVPGVMSALLFMLLRIPPAHAELVLSPEDPSLVLALVAASAAALPFVWSGVRDHLKSRNNKRGQGR
jgi:hypothetical protein